ncbi:HD domain-containing protein [Sulfobacillus thermosulfidooxidans DSM 9293]|uniref:HD domain-containing protein n=1 Tax=Sulfobacillus thermosulfidooxidans (strain DSM 9293 / VKM B-1269 / AT-1) TaxID=929705 RepID=A0A1W1WH91_SULTA|nr:HD domain-containing protein [Sulfobacillus thermosulfidooxidans]SMC05684.1 HD domain-containing protein [Sulfobacillus thermosulfidooxidans DSM 9293]
MNIGFIMDRDFLSGQPTDSVLVTQWLIKTSPHKMLYVTTSEGTLLGFIRLQDIQNLTGETLQEIMVPLAETQVVAPDDSTELLGPLFDNHPDWSSIPVVDKGKLIGVVPREWNIFSHRSPVEDSANFSLEPFQQQILDALYTGLIVVDHHGITRMLNPAGAEILDVKPEAVVGKPYEELAQYLFSHITDYLKGSAIPLALMGAATRGERQLRLPNHRDVLFKFGTIHHQGTLQAILVTFMDITAQKQAEALAHHQQQELEMAFALTLPNSKVEAKLKSSPEYQDVYDPESGKARVTRVIPDGTYRHVINGLRIMAELKAIGVFQLVGIDKDTLVQAFIFHDVGKAQPTLQVGQVFVPQDTFEPGFLHAGRSADWARRDYHVSTDVEWIVRYHHTRESDLPADFPSALKPMLRIFQLVDGLSAAITRRNARIAPMTLTGSVLTIDERNDDTRYDRRYQLSIYTGDIQLLSRT